MVTASLRKTRTAGAANPPAIVDAEVVSTTTVATPAGKETAQQVHNLEEIVSSPAPATDAPAAPAEQTHAVARTAAPGAVSVPRDTNFSESGFDGSWGSDDLKFPQLKQVQGSGPLSKEYDNGTIIYGDLELLPPPSVKADAKNPLIRFVPISLTKQFREKLGQEAVDAGEMPRIFNSVAEVEEAGLTTRWFGNTMPENYAEPSARCIFLLEKPEGTDHPGFALELDGKFYGVAVYYAAGGAFRDSAKIIFNTALTSLLVPIMVEGKPKLDARGLVLKKPMLWKNFWTLAFAKKQAGNFNPWCPIVKLTKDETSPAIRSYCEGLGLHAPAEAAGE